MAGILQEFTSRKGSKCVAVVQSALEDLKKGRSKDASKKLCKLKEDSGQLAAEAQQLANRLNRVEQHYICEGEAIQKEIGDLGCREEQLQRDMRNEETNLQSNQRVLWDNESKLRSARSEVEEAQRKLQRAEDKEGDDVKTGAIIGAIVGLPFFGVGAIAGAALGAGIGGIVEACKDEVREASDRLDRRRNDEERARSAVTESERRVANIRSQISGMQRKIGELKRKQQTYYEKVQDVKSSIVLLKESIEFWRLFQQASEHGQQRSTLLKRIVDKANEKGEYIVLSSRGSKRVATTFLEAWESLESMAAEGRSHILQIDFRCTYCSNNYTALPYVDKDSRFVCSQCGPRHAIMN